MSALSILKSQLPRNWFGDSSPNNDTMLSGAASVLDFISGLLDYVRQQTRISTATDRNLDFIAADYLGTSFFRRDGESDASYRIRIKRELLRPRATRAALDQALFDLTGRHPRIFEFDNTSDTGGYGHGNAYTGLAYGFAGGYGSLSLPFQFTVDAYRPNEFGGVPGVSGYGGPAGYGHGAIEYITRSQIIVAVSDQDILDTINLTIPVGTIAWTSIKQA